MLVNMLIICFSIFFTGFVLMLLKMRKIAKLRKEVDYTEHDGKRYGTLGIYMDMSTDFPLVDYLVLAVVMSFVTTLPLLFLSISYEDIGIFNAFMPLSMFFAMLTLIPLKRNKEVLLSKNVSLKDLFTKKSAIVSFRSDDIGKKFNELEKAVLLNNEQLESLKELNHVLAYWETIHSKHYSLDYNLKNMSLPTVVQIEMKDKMKVLEKEMDNHLPIVASHISNIHEIYYPNSNNPVSCNLSTLELEEEEVKAPLILQVGEQAFSNEYVVEVIGQFKSSEDSVIHHIGGFKEDEQEEMNILVALLHELKKTEPSHYGDVLNYEHWLAPSSLFDADWNGISDVVKRVATDWTIDPSENLGIPAHITAFNVVYYDEKGNKNLI